MLDPPEKFLNEPRLADTRLALHDDEPPLLARVHAFRPFPREELAAALTGARHVCVVDRAPAFGAPGPLGQEVRALGIPAADVVCGLGGGDVTPDTLRRAIARAREEGAAREAVYLGEEK